MAASAKKGKKRSWLGSLSFGSLSLVMSLLLLLCYLPVIVNPAKAWFFTLFGLLYPIVLPITAVLFVWALVRRSKMRLFLALALLPSAFFLGQYIQLGGKEESARKGSLKVISYNVGRFASSGYGWSRAALADSVAAYLMRQDADIICLQEFYLAKQTDIQNWVKRSFPGYRAEYYVYSDKNGSSGNLTLSRRPIVDKGKRTFENSANMALFTDIRLDSSTIRLYNCHFESYNISLPRIVKGITDDEIVEETERKMRRSISERPKQVSSVLSAIDASKTGCMVAGDFNDTPLSYTYLRLSRGRKDCFVKAGKGFGATYRTLWPLLRIDYQLFPAELEATGYRIDKVKYSDHYPIIATYNETGRSTR